jgi:hypothetical protein
MVLLTPEADTMFMSFQCLKPSPEEAHRVTQPVATSTLSASEREVVLKAQETMTSVKLVI